MSIPLLEVQFGKDGHLLNPAEERAVIDALKAADPSAQAVVISHGWNNDMNEARTLYREFLRNLEIHAGAAASKIVAIGVLWPSKRFTDAELIPGGAASADTDPKADRAIVERLEEMKPLFGDAEANERLDKMKALVPGMAADPGKQRAFVALLGEIADRHLDDAQRSADEGSAKLSGQDGAALLKSFGAPIISQKVVAGAGGAAAVGGIGGNPALAAAGGLGGNPAMRPANAAAGIGDFFSGIKAGALRLLNFTTYQTMKDRAGTVGRDGLNPLLGRIQASVPGTISFHFVGHSFGGRVVTAAVDGPNKLRVKTLLLLQAAYSHNGLAADFDGRGAKGFFHAILGQRKVDGPILITHSKHDRAVGLAYPLASRLNGDNAAGIGDKDDQFGGMGANGAQHVGDQRLEIALQPVGGTYDFASGGKRVFNLNGDSIITDHGDVARAETAFVLAKAMGVA